MFDLVSAANLNYKANHQFGMGFNIFIKKTLTNQNVQWSWTNLHWTQEPTLLKFCSFECFGTGFERIILLKGLERGSMRRQEAINLSTFVQSLDQAMPLVRLLLHSCFVHVSLSLNPLLQLTDARVCFTFASFFLPFCFKFCQTHCINFCEALKLL